LSRTCRSWSAVIAASAQPQLRSRLYTVLEQMRQNDWDNLAGAVRRILDSEPDDQRPCRRPRRRGFADHPRDPDLTQ
jgi:hypothetical protein